MRYAAVYKADTERLDEFIRRMSALAGSAVHRMDR
jgi:hypothetical protein